MPRFVDLRFPESEGFVFLGPLFVRVDLRLLRNRLSPDENLPAFQQTHQANPGVGNNFGGFQQALLQHQQVFIRNIEIGREFIDAVASAIAQFAQIRAQLQHLLGNLA